MLLLRAEALHSCPQMAWSVYRKTVAEILSPPDELILFCGMSIGFEDATVGYRPLHQMRTRGSGAIVNCSSLGGLVGLP